MGILNWFFNRTNDGDVKIIRARHQFTLTNEINKWSKKGYKLQTTSSVNNGPNTQTELIATMVLDNSNDAPRKEEISDEEFEEAITEIKTKQQDSTPTEQL